MNSGHKVSFAQGIYGGYQAIMYDARNKVYYGASESRKDGQAAGYQVLKITNQHGFYIGLYLAIKFRPNLFIINILPSIFSP